MHKTLLAVDGSEPAKHALELASDLAQKYDSDLLILHVSDPHPLSEDEIRMAEIEYADELSQYARDDPLKTVSQSEVLRTGVSLSRHQEISGLIHRLMGQKMLEVSKAHARAKGVETVETRLETGDPAQMIIETAEKTGANLIILGNRGRGSFKSLVLGSVSTKVNQLSPVNVITVR